MSKPSIPKGTRDFGPVEMARRNYIFDTIRAVFKKYGYQPIETPAMEKLETLTGKYGEEGDRLIFKVLARGEKLKNALETNSNNLADEALRYDLTVPFARYVVQHQNEISFPFKRYQIQPVWRADRPQKGRYREFYQCDVDVIGSDSLLNEVELIELIDEVFTRLQLDDAVIQINNRKLLFGYAELWGMADRFKEFATIIDKKDKIGIDGVYDELVVNDMIENNSFIEKLDKSGLESFFNHAVGSAASTADLMDFLRELDKKYKKTDTGARGFGELKLLFNFLGNSDASRRVMLNQSLARGLSYYTGTIFEVTVSNFPSICGGGRYDDLTGIFGLPNVSGVGVSFGADRIYDVLLERDLFPESASTSTQVMFVNFGETEAKYCLGVVNQLREKGIAAELYPDEVKMKKQMKYANDKGIPYVVMVGSREMETGQLAVKKMDTGDQAEMDVQTLIEQFA